MAELATIARPYADALFQTLGRDIGAHAGHAGGLADQLDALARVTADPQLKRLADDPKAQPMQVTGVLNDVLKGMGVMPGLPLQNLIATLVENGRLAAVPDIARQFRNHVNAARGVADAVISSAFPLADHQVQELMQTLERRFGRSLKAHVEVDPDLIGGIRVAVGDEVLDTSIRARLEQMKSALTA